MSDLSINVAIKSPASTEQITVVGVKLGRGQNSIIRNLSLFKINSLISLQNH